MEWDTDRYRPRQPLRRERKASLDGYRASLGLLRCARHLRMRSAKPPKARASAQVKEEVYSLAIGAGWERKTPAPDTWEAIRKAATTAGTLISLRN